MRFREANQHRMVILFEEKAISCNRRQLEKKNIQQVNMRSSLECLALNGMSIHYTLQKDSSTYAEAETVEEFF